MKSLGHIVVGWDGTPAAADALALAKVFAAAGAETLTVATVPEPGVDAHAALAAVDAELPYGNRHRIVTLDEGRPSERLLELADALAPATIVLGPSSRHAAPAALGSVAEQILHRSAHPVAIASAGFAAEPDPGLRVLGVAFDGSDEARAALRLAEGLAMRSHGTLRILGVFEEMSRTAGGFYGYSVAPALARDGWHELLEEAAVSVDSSLRPLPLLVSGDPAGELARASASIDVLVMGSRARGAVGRVVRGSVSSRVARAGVSPVLVVPRAAAREPLAVAAAG